MHGWNFRDAKGFPDTPDDAGAQFAKGEHASCADIRNLLLAKLPSRDWALVAPHLEMVTLKERQVVEAPGKPITHVYFVETGMVSVVAENAEDHRIEVGVIGREGMTGVPVIHGDDRAQHLAYLRIGGHGRRMTAAAFLAALDKCPALRNLAWKSAHAFAIQTAHAALANGRAKLEERLARWLLMARDRLDGDSVPLTHELLALMLGVRRAGVTVTLHSFERRGLVATRRGRLTLLDRTGIEKIAGAFYGAPEAELKRLMGD